MGSCDSSNEDRVLAARAVADLSAIPNLFNLSPDGIVVTDVQGVIRDANLRAAELFGYRQSELIKQPIEILVPERLRNAHVGHRENYAAHSFGRRMGMGLELSGLRKDGTEFPIDIMLKPLQTAEGLVTLSFVRDMSEEWAALEELRRVNCQFRLLVDSVSDHAIYLLDKDGFVITWNSGAEWVKGYKAEEIVGRSFSLFFTREDVERGKPAELLQLAAQRGRVGQEGWRVRKDGSRFWADVVLTAIRNPRGELIGYAKVTRDFTDRKRAEESVLLRLSQALLDSRDLRKLLEAISESLRELIPHDAATLGMYCAGDDTLEVHFLGLDKHGTRRAATRIPVEGSPAGLAFRNGEPVVLDRIQGGPFVEAGIKHLTRLGMQSGCWVPLMIREERIGALMVASRIESAFHEQEVGMLSEISGRVAVAANNATAFRRALDLREKLAEEKKYLEEEINLENQFDDIVGESTGLKEVLKQIEIVAPTDATVLIQGETGTGKELLARAIHRLSRRCDRTFFKLNCAAIPAGLLESELFGHEKGAFTGAIARKIGRLEVAHEGTLFLDEIGELPLELQPKLLRALQEKEFERLGGNRSIPVDVRLIAASNRDLARMVERREFRSDLFYRLKVFPIFAPALRDRAEDIPMLVRHFVAAHCRRMGKAIDTIPEEAMEALAKWSWPGNIRELENLLERAVILTRGSLLYVPLAELAAAEQEEADSAENTTLHEADREHILHVLRDSGGQIGGEDGAAEKLGLKRTTLNSKIKKLGIERSDYM